MNSRIATGLMRSQGDRAAHDETAGDHRGSVSSCPVHLHPCCGINPFA